MIHHSEAVERCAHCGRAWCGFCETPTTAISLNAIDPMSRVKTQIAVFCGDDCYRAYEHARTR